MTKKKTIQQKKFYDYADWFEGRITLGGLQTTNSLNELTPIVNVVDVDEFSLKEIRKQQEILFNSDVEHRLAKLIEGVKDFYLESEDKIYFVEETLKDFDNLFTVKCDTSFLHFRLLNKSYTRDEINKFQWFLQEHIQRGNRNYYFMQSPRQINPSFRVPPIEVEAEVFYRCAQYIRKELQYKNEKLTHKEIALIYYYSGKKIDRQNAGSIVKNHKLRSGDKLYQIFTFYTKQINRIGIEKTDKQDQMKIQLLEGVKTHLQRSHIETSEIEKDIKLLRANILQGDE